MPISVNYTDIVVSTFEDFEDVGIDPLTDAVSFDGFTASVDQGTWSLIQSAFCSSSSDRCLINGTALSDVRTFDSFIAETRYFGFDLNPAVTTDDIYKVDVLGVSGLLSIEFTGPGFYAFGDELGLLSVSISNLGDGMGGFTNYAIDDVVTGTELIGEGLPVPEPGPLALLTLSLAGLCFRRRR